MQENTWWKNLWIINDFWFVWNSNLYNINHFILMMPSTYLINYPPKVYHYTATTFALFRALERGKYIPSFQVLLTRIWGNAKHSTLAKSVCHIPHTAVRWSFNYILFTNVWQKILWFFTSLQIWREKNKDLAAQRKIVPNGKGKLQPVCIEYFALCISTCSLTSFFTEQESLFVKRETISVSASFQTKFWIIYAKKLVKL